MTKLFYKNSIIFVLGDILNKSVPFFMLPVLTRYLTPEGYGKVAMFTVLVSILFVFVGLTIHGAINVNYFRLNKSQLKVYISNTMMILAVSASIIFVFVWIFSPYLLKKILLERQWLLIAVVLAAAQFLTTVNLGLWMIDEKPKFYTIYQITQTLLTSALSILFVVGYNMGWEGELLAISLGTVTFSIISMGFIYKRGYFLWEFNKEYTVDALKFGIPLIPHTLSGWIKTGADRVIIMYVLGSAVVGVYSVAYQISMVILVLVTALNKAWIPYLFKTLSSKPSFSEKIKIVKFTYVYFIIVIVIAFIFTIIAQLLIPYFLGEKFILASEYIIYFSMAFSFQGMYFMIGNYIFYVKKTHILSYVSLLSAVIHMLLLYLFLEKYGIIGAAYTTCISAFITFILVWYLSAKVYPMPWNIFKGLKDVNS